MTDRSNVDWLMDDLCENLGLSLPARAREELEQIGLNNVDAFTDAVLAAEGLDPGADKALRFQVRAMVARYTDD